VALRCRSASALRTRKAPCRSPGGLTTDRRPSGLVRSELGRAQEGYRGLPRPLSCHGRMLRRRSLSRPAGPHVASGRGNLDQPGRVTVLDTVAAGTVLAPTLEGPGPPRIVVASVGARSPAQRSALAAGIRNGPVRPSPAPGWRPRWLHACLHRRLPEARATIPSPGPSEPFVASPLSNARLATKIAERADVSLGGQTLERTDDRRVTRPNLAFSKRGRQCHGFRYGSGRHGTCDGEPRPGPC
jgi:hypothetical protein